MVLCIKSKRLEKMKYLHISAFSLVNPEFKQNLFPSFLIKFRIMKTSICSYLG